MTETMSFTSHKSVLVWGVLWMTLCGGTCLGQTSDASDVDRQLAQQRQQLEQLQADLDELRSELDSKEADECEDPYGQLEIHGFLSQGYLKSDGLNLIPRAKDGTFELNEMAMNASSQLTPKLRVGLQLMSRDFGQTDNNKVKLDWAVIDYRWRDVLGLRAGRMKMASGLYSDTRDIDALRTCILLPINNIYHENWREVFGYVNGIGLYGDVMTEDWGLLSYQAQYGMTYFDSHDGATSQLAQSITVFGDFQDMDSDYVGFGRLDWYPPMLEGLKLGTSYGQFQYSHDYTVTAGSYPTSVGYAVGDTFTWKFDNLRFKTFSSEYTRGDWVLFGEWMTTEIASDISKTHMRNWWLGSTYQLNDRLNVGAYHSTSYNVDSDRSAADNHTYDTALSLRCDLTLNWLVKAEIHYIDGTKDMNSAYNPDGYEKGHCWMWLLKTTVWF